MTFKRGSRIRFERYKRYKKYEIWFELLEGNNVVGQFRIPAQAIINTFKDIAICEEDGYSDVIDKINIQILSDLREKMM